MTNQNMLMDNSETFVKSLVSSYRKMKAIIDINGSEAKMAPQKLERLAISEIAKMSTAEPIILMI